MEDVKHEQLLMLTFSRAAATEFKKRLLKLIGNAAHYVEIKTFHSYCFDLLGKVGSLEKSDSILKKTVEKIRNKEVETNRITKTVLVIDEAQDIALDEFELIKTIIRENDDLRVIAVGDDDQNIFEFRGANSKYLQQLMQISGATQYSLVENYRSKNNIVDFANQFAETITQRLKTVPIISKQTENGKIKVVRHRAENLLMPLVNDLISTPLAGSTCILVQTNDDALQMTGLLLKNGISAKLIQTNDYFNLYNLAEIRFFIASLNLLDQIRVITDDAWSDAKRALAVKFKNTNNLAVCENLIKDFEAVNTKIKYKSDLDVFIRESKLEDFYPNYSDVIFVSTIHKVKGKEFDNVFLMLNNFKIASDEEKRKIYVAITRSKQNLTIHDNNGFFDKIIVDDMETIEDHEMYEPPPQLVKHLTHEDLWLDYFIDKQQNISPLMAGDTLIIKENGCVNQKGQPILKFSKKILKEIETLKYRNFELRGAKVNYVIYWQKENNPHETIIILPKLYFEKVKHEPIQIT
jgi:ATP-dependent DNA helicase RecQ